MNRLNPHLKRLMKWARAGSAERFEIPPGFAARMAARAQQEASVSEVEILQRVIFLRILKPVGWVSATTILAGLIVLFVQDPAGASTLDLIPAYQLVAQIFSL